MPVDKRAGDMQSIKQHTAQPLPPRLPRESVGSQVVNQLGASRRGVSPSAQGQALPPQLPKGQQVNPLPPQAQLPQNQRVPASAITPSGKPAASTKLGKAELAEQKKNEAEGRLTKEQKRQRLQAIGATESVFQDIQGILPNVTKGIGELPTPGSIATPLIILLFLFLMILPVNGMTRLQWLWLVITGNAQVSETAPQTSTPATGSGPLGVNFGSGPAQAQAATLPGGIVIGGTTYTYSVDEW